MQVCNKAFILNKHCTFFCGLIYWRGGAHFCSPLEGTSLLTSPGIDLWRSIHISNSTCHIRHRSISMVCCGNGSTYWNRLCHASEPAAAMAGGVVFYVVCPIHVNAMSHELTLRERTTCTSNGHLINTNSLRECSPVSFKEFNANHHEKT